MLATLLYAAGMYMVLATVLLACWGIGSFGIGARINSSSDGDGDGPLLAVMAVLLGLAVAICVCQGLAVAGGFNAVNVGLMWAMGLLSAAVRLWRRWRQPHRSRTKPEPWTPAARVAFALLALLLLSTLPKPLGPPLAWDELMYHLPHARLWALDGKLTVHPWLRYPWFPYNIDLLYACALLFGSDVMPHLLNGACGWLTALLVYRLGRQYADRTTACIAAAIWLKLTGSEYASAYVDMPVSLFVFGGMVGFLQWHRSRAADGADARRWLAIGALFLGVAAGSKYQALMVLPPFAVLLVRRDRSAKTGLIAVAALLLPSAYWYARNTLQTGDPFAPIGGRFFGFTDWNLEDYRVQFADLHKNAGWPHWLLWPALFTPFMARMRKRPEWRAALWLGAYLLATWALTSRYPRYLMPAYPVLALLAATAWLAGGRLLLSTPPLRAVRERLGTVRNTHRPLPAWGLLAVACLALLGTNRHIGRIAPTEARRERVLAANVTGYDTLVHLRQLPPGKVYQMGLEDAIYYTPGQVHGDVFGPWRYRDFSELAPEALHRVLVQQDFDTLLVHSARVPGVESRPGFRRFFERLHAHGDVSLYRVVRDTP